MATSKADRIRHANAEILAEGNLAAIDDVFSADYVLHAGGKDRRGRKFVRDFVTQLRTAIPNLRVADVTILAQTGVTVAWSRTLRGTHKADMRGIPASGKKVEWREMFVTRFDGKLIAEEWAVSELAAELLLKQPKRAGS
jgi:steroid delta-isomerase-like uncharacterized protein